MIAATFDELIRNPEAQTRVWQCPAHGIRYGEDEPEPGRVAWSCPQCEREAQFAERDYRATLWHYNWWLRNSGVPFRYRSAVASSIKPASPSGKLLLAAVTSYCATLEDRGERGEGLTLLGPPGTGKTLALAAIINSACAGRIKALYASWPDVLADVKSGFNGPRDDERRTLIDRLAAVPLLALDELGIKTQSDFEAAELFRLIDSRYSNQLPTLTATNATRQTFAQLVGERVADRLLECAPAVALSGGSQRGQLKCEGPNALTPPTATLTLRTHLQGAWRERVIDFRDQLA